MWKVFIFLISIILFALLKNEVKSSNFSFFTFCFRLIFLLFVSTPQCLATLTLLLNYFHYENVRIFLWKYVFLFNTNCPPVFCTQASSIIKREIKTQQTCSYITKTMVYLNPTIRYTSFFFISMFYNWSRQLIVGCLMMGACAI